MSAYMGSSRHVRVEIIATSGPWIQYRGQQCDAIIYDPPVSPQINTEQLSPPFPKWQMAKPEDIKEVQQ